MNLNKFKSIRIINLSANGWKIIKYLTVFNCQKFLIFKNFLDFKLKESFFL